MLRAGPRLAVLGGGDLPSYGEEGLSGFGKLPGIVVVLLSMDPVRNPFTPRSGSRPPVLAGREQQLAAFRNVLERLHGDRPAKNLWMTGLHSVGKTALLTVFEGMAENAGFHVAAAEVSRDTAFAALAVRLVRRALLSLGGLKRPTLQIRRAADELQTFGIRMPGGVDTNADTVGGYADGKALADGVAALFVALGRAAVDHGSAAVLLLDEVHLIGHMELAALVNALNQCALHRLPVSIVGAGLPQLPTATGEANFYAAESFDFLFVDRLADVAARAALEEPAKACGAAFQPEAMRRIIRFTRGYPYFIQEYGKHSWNLAQSRIITVKDVEAAHPVVQMHLDDNFFRSRIDRATAIELAYLRSMADLNVGPYRSGEVAARLGRGGSESVAPVRARLIDKGLIYSPRYGFSEFAVPNFADFLRRNYRPEMIGAR
jgi:hypothetical protein